MIFPIGDEQVQGGDKPIFSYSFIVANIGVFIWMMFFYPSGDIQDFYNAFGSIPAELEAGEKTWTLISAMFIHGGWMHLVGNMIFLWVFADNIEASVGSMRFLVFYFLGGILAGVAHAYFNQGSIIPAVGASGAISAVLGAYMVMFPTSQIRVYILIFFRSAYLPAFLFLGIWMLQQTVAGVGSLGSTNLDTGGVAWWAHIGGFVFGVVVGFLFRNTARRRRSRMLV